MKVATDQVGAVSVVRVAEPRLTYSLLPEFSSTVTGLVTHGAREVLIDLAPVTYLDSAAIGCLMDLFRQINHAGGRLKLSGVQRRVQALLTLTGTQHFIEIHADESAAIDSFGA
jgi:anti-sigma B factor antagonist